MKPRKRSTFSLIEIIIAMALMSLVISSMMGTYVYFQRGGAKQDRIIKEQSQIRLLNYRLKNFFLKLKPLTESKIPQQLFYSSNVGGEGIVFCFDKGASSPPKNANEVLYRLYLDEEKSELHALYWAHPKKEEKQNAFIGKEVLFSNIETLTFEFFEPPKGTPGSIGAKEIDPGKERQKEGWNTYWNYEWNELPTMIRLHFSMKGKEGEGIVTLAFPIPRANKPIMLKR